MKSSLWVWVVGATFSIGLSFWWMDRSSDESILRAEFLVPSKATVVSYKAHPSQNAWVREGLDIEIVFQLDKRDYANYVAEAERVGLWQTLPIPEEFLLRMGAIESRVERYKALTKQWERKASGDDELVNNKTRAQLLAKFIATLPETSQVGLFQCRVAGDNIMYSPKTIETNLERDLKDFMLAILDHKRRQIVIKVSTSY